MTASSSLGTSSGTTSAPPDTVPDLRVDEVTALLFREARLLDDVQWDKWLDLFTEDGLYWIPLEDTAAGPDRDLAIAYDDAEGRAARVFRRQRTRVYDQDPPSRTVHAVCNVEVVGTDDEGDVVVYSTQFVGEVRAGGDAQIGLNSPRLLMARVEHRLQLTDDGPRIRMKKVLLLDRAQPLYNMSFLI